MSNTIDIKRLEHILKNNPEYAPYKINIKNDVDSFLKIRETLSRIGRYQNNSGTNKDILWQVCHIMKDDNNNFYIVHFKHLYMLHDSNKETVFNEQDYNQLTHITNLLKSWDMLTLEEDISESQYSQKCNITILSYAKKREVILRKKFFIRKK